MERRLNRTNIAEPSEMDRMIEKEKDGKSLKAQYEMPEMPEMHFVFAEHHGRVGMASDLSHQDIEGPAWRSDAQRWSTAMRCDEQSAVV